MEGTEEAAVVAQFNGFLMSRLKSFHVFSQPFSPQEFEASEPSNNGGPNDVRKAGPGVERLVVVR